MTSATNHVGCIQKTAKQQKTSNNLDIWRKVRQWQDNNGKTHRTLKLPISLPFFAFGLVPFLDLDCWIDFGFWQNQSSMVINRISGISASTISMCDTITRASPLTHTCTCVLFDTCLKNKNYMRLTRISKISKSIFWRPMTYALLNRRDYGHRTAGLLYFWS